MRYLLVVGLLLIAAPSRADLYEPAMLQQEDTGSQHALEEVQRFLGVPFLGVRAALVLPGAALGEFGNGLLRLIDAPAPGTFPHAESGWLWRGALRSLGDDWNESTPGS